MNSAKKQTYAVGYYDLSGWWFFEGIFSNIKTAVKVAKSLSKYPNASSALVQNDSGYKAGERSANFWFVNGRRDKEAA